MESTNSVKVDVITIARNSANDIHDTLDSISDQDYPNIFHIIIDGRSEDNTVSIVDSYKHNKEKSVFSQNGRGIANAFNEGIEKTSGDLVIFLNSGDTLFDSSVITKLVNSYNELKWDWAFGETLAVSRRGKLTRYVKQHKSWSKELFYYGNPICHQSTIFTNKLLKNVGLYDENLLLEMDFDYNIRSALISSPHLLYFPVACYDVSGVSSVKVFSVNDIHRRIRRKYFELDKFSDFLVESICFFKAFKRFLLIPLKTLI